MYALMDRFGTEYEDPTAELKMVRQNRSVKDYINKFDKIMTRLSILPEAISVFITGLKPEIGYTVKNHRPFSLPQAYQFARNTEVQVQAQLKLSKPNVFTGGSQYKGSSYQSFHKGAGTRKDYSQTKKEVRLNLNKNSSRKLTSAEMNKRRQKGLCFFYDEKFFPGHKCGGAKSLYLLEVEEEGGSSEEDVVEVDDPEQEKEEEHGEVYEISVHALHGIPTYHTLRVEGYCQKRSLQILIDPGSSHNFMDEGLTREIKGDIQTVKSHAINVADGHDRYTKELCKSFS